MIRERPVGEIYPSRSYNQKFYSYAEEILEVLIKQDLEDLRQHEQYQNSLDGNVSMAH